MTQQDTLEIIKRGADELLLESELKQKLAQNRPLRIKAGFDPSAPDIHLGHTVLLKKLRDFQDAGHIVQSMAEHFVYCWRRYCSGNIWTRQDNIFDNSFYFCCCRRDTDNTGAEANTCAAGQADAGYEDVWRPKTLSSAANKSRRSYADNFCFESYAVSADNFWPAFEYP